MRQPTLEEFLADDSYRNAWCRHEHYKIYVRRTVRQLDERCSCLDLASIEAKRPRGGRLEEFFEQLELLARENGLEAIFVENVIPVFFREWLKRRGYAERGVLDFPSYWKILEPRADPPLTISA